MKYETLIKKVNQYNKQFDLIKNEGYLPKTATYEKMTAFAEFIPNTGKNKGKILTYREAKTRLKNLKYDVSTFTKDYYLQEVSDLLGQIAPYSSFGKFESEVYDDLQYKMELLIDYFDSMGIEHNLDKDKISDIPTKELYNMFKEASELKTKTKPSDNSFYIELEKIVGNYLKLQEE